MNRFNKILENGWIFATSMWFSSRLVIAISMLVIAPLLPVAPNMLPPTFSWDVFSAWDSIWYAKIVMFGYEYAADAKQHSVAFFPLFPLAVRGVMNLGLSFEMAGTLINNAAFFAALVVVYYWVEEQHGMSGARWATAVLAWCPLSLFGSVVYTEGLFLFLSAATLRAFDRKEYAWAALCGAIATASRPPAMALIPAMLITSWVERRGAKAYAASVLTSAGVCLYALYCYKQFGDALAFVHAQKGWRENLGFEAEGWWRLLMFIILGPANWKHGDLVNFWHPLLFLLIIASGYVLWRCRNGEGVQNLPFLATMVDYSFASLGFSLWVLAGNPAMGDPLSKVVMIFGGAYLLWNLRTKLSLITVTYGFCGIGLLLASGGTISLNRLAYGIVSLSVALGVLLSYRHPRWGFMLIGLFGFIMTRLAVRFAQHLWVA